MSNRLMIDADYNERIALESGERVCLRLIRPSDKAAMQRAFADETFDLVISTGSLHHWKDPIRSLAEMHRVTRQGGYALMYGKKVHCYFFN